MCGPAIRPPCKKRCRNGVVHLVALVRDTPWPPPTIRSDDRCDNLSDRTDAERWFDAALIFRSKRCGRRALIGFLAPAFLALAVLAGVPLLVHLLRRRIGRTVEFPAVRYLARMEQEHSRELKLRHRLLLFLRVLAVVALALAAARPMARLAGLGHAPVALALVVDNSMSSGAVRDGQAVIDGLRADARALISS